MCCSIKWRLIFHLHFFLVFFISAGNFALQTTPRNLNYEALGITKQEWILIAPFSAFHFFRSCCKAIKSFNKTEKGKAKTATRENISAPNGMTIKCWETPHARKNRDEAEWLKLKSFIIDVKRRYECIRRKLHAHCRNTSIKRFMCVQSRLQISRRVKKKS